MSNTPKKQDDNNNTNMESSDSIFSDQANKMQAFFEQKSKAQDEKIKELENALKSKDMEIAILIQKIEKIIINQDYTNLKSLVHEYKGQVSLEKEMLMNIEKFKWAHFYKGFEEKMSLIDKRLNETDFKVSHLFQKLENERKLHRTVSPDVKLEQNLKSLLEKGGKRLPTQDQIKNSNILFLDPISLKVAISPYVINKYLDNADKIKSFIVALINSFKEDFSKLKSLLGMNRLLIDTFPTTNDIKNRYDNIKNELVNFSNLMKERFALALKEENFVRYENWKKTTEIVVDDQLKFEEIGSRLKETLVDLHSKILDHVKGIYEKMLKEKDLVLKLRNS